MNATIHDPHPTTGTFKLSDEIADKKGFAARWKFSTRHVDNLLASGLPHLAIGKRRVRIIIVEGDAWMKERFGTRRIGRAAAVAAVGGTETDHAR